MKNMVWNEEYGEWRTKHHKDTKSHPSEYVEVFYCSLVHPEVNYRRLGVFHKSKFNSLFPVGRFTKIATGTWDGLISSWYYYPLDIFRIEGANKNGDHFYVVSRPKEYYLEKRARLLRLT